MDNQHEVRYDIYCPGCIHLNKKETEDPCNECLNQGWNTDSRKPIHFQENKELKEKKNEQNN